LDGSKGGLKSVWESVVVRKADQPIVHWRQVALVERFSSVMFPIDIEELLAELPTLGYIIPAEKDRLRRQGEQLALTREIATKGELRLKLNQEAKLLGIEGKETAQVLDAFKALRSLCTERLSPSTGFATAFVEITGMAWVETGKEPRKVFTKIWSNDSTMDHINKALKMKFVNLGINLVSSLEFESNSLCNIVVQPLTPSNSRYHVQVVWREPELDEVLKVMERLDQTVLSTIQALEAL
jgi:hypothetical protein